MPLEFFPSIQYFHIYFLYIPFFTQSMFIVDTDKTNLLQIQQNIWNKTLETISAISKYPERITLDKNFKCYMELHMRHKNILYRAYLKLIIITTLPESINRQNFSFNATWITNECQNQFMKDSCIIQIDNL